MMENETTDTRSAEPLTLESIKDKLHALPELTKPWEFTEDEHAIMASSVYCATPHGRPFDRLAAFRVRIPKADQSTIMINFQTTQSNKINRRYGLQYRIAQQVFKALSNPRPWR